VQLTKLTQAQAARAAGVSRTTIWRAIKDGQLSYERGEGKNVLIDASELLRLYPSANLERSDERSVNDAPNAREHEEAHANAGEIRVLRELVDELRQDKTRLQTELDRAGDERRKLMEMFEAKDRLLTDQRTGAERARSERHSLSLFRWFRRAS
jgi:excisionase family DNA binding protein